MPYSIPAVPVVVLAAPPGSGKTWLLNHWASQVPAGQRWTFITRGDASAFSESEGASAPKAQGAHIIALAHDCACCNGKLVLRTHLARTLRMRRPDRLFIEATLDDHLPATLQWLEGPDWDGWLTQVRSVLLLPLLVDAANHGAGTPLTEAEKRGLACADVVCFSPSPSPSPLPRGSEAADTHVQGAAGLGPAPEIPAYPQSTVACQAAERLLQARITGGARQWRINAPLKKLEWGVVQHALASGRRRI